MESVTGDAEVAQTAEDFADLTTLFRNCESLLKTLAQDGGPVHGVRAREQTARFNIWATNMEIYSEGRQPLGSRLEDTPEKSKMIRSLLLSLKTELGNLLRSTELPEDEGSSDTQYGSQDEESEWSSIGSESLPSLEKDNDAPATLQARLWVPIQGTITILQQLALVIKQSGRRHRQERIDRFRNSKDNKQVYDTIKRYAQQKMDHLFPNASAILRIRMAESIVWRRARFSYLIKHDEKLAALSRNAPGPKKAEREEEGLTPVPQQIHPFPERSAPTLSKTSKADMLSSIVLSSTVNTKHDEERHRDIAPERTESVASVSIPGGEFPKRPKMDTTGASFKCPYCRLVFPAEEATKEQWRKHVIKDFEPFFCLYDDCSTPFIGMQTYTDWIAHIRENHVQHRWKCWYCESSDSACVSFPKAEELEEHVRCQHEDKTTEVLHSTLMRHSAVEDPQNFTGCPLCGGFPEELEKMYPDQRNGDAGAALEQHIKHDLFKLALIMQPIEMGESEENLKDERSEAQRDADSERDSTEKLDVGGLFICDRDECDCRDLKKNSASGWTNLKSTFEPTSGIPRDKLPATHDDPAYVSTMDGQSEWRFWQINLPKYVGHSEDRKLMEYFKIPLIFSTEKYTTGWICDTRMGATAAMAFLDEQHDQPVDLSLSPHDRSSYIVGKMGEKYVAIVATPPGEYGTTSAAYAASGLLRNFQNIRIGLMVGHGGGAPSLEHDIRLGDVVVSTPRGAWGGVVQYDHGKAMQDGTFQPTGSLNAPPRELLNAVSQLRVHYTRDGHRIQDSIDEVLARLPNMREEFQRPNPASDRLYHARFVHPDRSKSCADICGDDQLNVVRRRQRDDNEDNPAIHYGLIASGNTLVRDASLRDRLAEQYGVLCFEMAAAGLMNSFPCIVVRGISDYADTHKSPAWQGYAAMTAAAYAKDLLGQIETLRSQSGRDAVPALLEIDTGITTERILAWLAAPDPSENHNIALQKRYPESCEWISHNDQYSKWSWTPSSFLCIVGSPGCGKTVLTAAIIESLKAQHSHNVLYFYFDSTDKRKESLDCAVCSLVGQLCLRIESPQHPLAKLYLSCNDGHSQPSSPSLYKTFESIIRQAEQTWIVLDALDECRTRRKLLLWLKSLLSSMPANLHLLVTSRANQEIVSTLTGSGGSQCKLTLGGDLLQNDINAYIRGIVRNGNGLRRWRSRPNVQDEIERTLIQTVDGMFLWASSQLDALEDCVDTYSLRKQLTSLPETLEDTYARILGSVPKQRIDQGTRILQFIVFSERPLQVDEAVDVVAVRTDAQPRFAPEERIPDPLEVLRYCPSLITCETRRETDDGQESMVLRLAHISVRMYLLSDHLEQEIARPFQETFARASIAKVCLAYLLEVNHRLSVREIRKSFPLAQYAARYWMKHVFLAEKSDNELNALMREFFSTDTAYKTCYRLYNPDRPWNHRPDQDAQEVPPRIYYASIGGLARVVRWMIDEGADCDCPAEVYGNALQAASFEGHVDVVTLLLECGSDPNTEGCGEYGTALQAASWQGHEHVVRLLLEKGANVASQGGKFGSALEAASQRGHWGVCELLRDFH